MISKLHSARAAIFSVVSVVASQGVAFALDSTGTPGEKLYQRADWVFNNAEQVHYGHRRAPALQQVKSFSNGRCEADTDCSGFVSYVLAEFPRQYATIRDMQPDRKYPQAKIYMQFFSELKADSPTSGWLKVAQIEELRRGDLIAWKKPQPPEGVKKKTNSGHVAIVIDRQGAIEETEINGKKVRFQSVNVIDSSSVKHFQPEHLPPLSMMPHRDGVGKGVVRIILDDANRPIGYWEGTYWYEGSKEIEKPTFTESIAFARLVVENN